MEIRLRRARVEDAPTLNAFHNDAYGERRTVTQWLWQFHRTTLADGTLPFVVAELDGNVVGTQALIPIRALGPSGTFLSGKSEETLLAPECRGQGVFERMYDILYETANEMGVSAIWGFTPAERAFLRVGFETPGKTRQLLRLLRPSGLAAFSTAAGGTMRQVTLSAAGALGVVASDLRSAAGRLGRPSRSLEVEDLHGSPSTATSISQAFAKLWGGTTILRDQEYLEWRLFTNPYVRPHVVGVSHRGNLFGYVAFCVGQDGVGYLVDIHVAPVDLDVAVARSGIFALLSHATQRMKRMGASSIRAWSMTKHPFDLEVERAARTLGFWPVDRGSHVVFNRAIRGASNSAGVQDFEQWSVTRVYTQGVTG